MRLLIVSIILVFSIPASATKLIRKEINTTLKDIKSEVVINNGVEGIWFSKEDSERLLHIIDVTLPDLLDLIDLQTNKISSLTLSKDSYKESNEELSKTSLLSTQALNIALDNINKFQQPQYAWYENRIAMYVYGIITATVILMTSAYLLDQIKP